MSRLRVAAFVSGGPMALRALDALAAAHEVAVIVRARPLNPPFIAWRAMASRVVRALGFRPADDVTAWARARGVPVIQAAADAGRAAARIRSLRPDVGCVATWPRKVPDELLVASGRGCLNLHASLLPRHRGANPLFWTYHEGDAAGGVSVHLVTARLDAGAIMLQEPVPITRGESVVDVHARCAATGGAMLARAVTQLAEASGVRREQDESAVTRAPSPVAGRSYARLTEWSSAQAWHFLAGLLARCYREPLVDRSGAAVRYTRVEGFEVRSPAHPPGSIVRDGAGWTAWTPDGVVRIA